MTRRRIPWEGKRRNWATTTWIIMTTLRRKMGTQPQRQDTLQTTLTLSSFPLRPMWSSQGPPMKLRSPMKSNNPPR